MHREYKGRVALRIALFLLGAVLVALGIALSVKSGLGVSAISSFPYAISIVTGIEMSWWLFANNIMLILLQVALMGRHFKIRNLTQIPFAIILSASLGVTQRVLKFEVSAYWLRFIVMLISVLCFAVGIYLLVEANIAINIPEGLNNAITSRFSFRFSRVKICIDMTYVILALLTGLLFLHRMLGVREGTLISAALTGWLIGAIPMSFKKWLHAKCYGNTADMGGLVE